MWLLYNNKWLSIFMKSLMVYKMRPPQSMSMYEILNAQWMNNTLMDVKKYNVILEAIRLSLYSAVNVFVSLVTSCSLDVFILTSEAKGESLEPL